MMPWQRVLHDFHGLVNEVTERTGKRALARGVGHDKQTIRPWLGKGLPTFARDAAWLIRLALENRIDVSRFQTFAPIYDLSPQWSYELNMRTDLPDLSWLTGISQPPVVRSTFCGIELESPLGIAASPLTADERWTCLMLDLGFRPVTFKTRRTSYRRPHVPPQIAYVKEPPDLSQLDPRTPPEVLVTYNRAEAPGHIPNLVNSLGVPSENPADWRVIYERIADHRGGKSVGISVMGEASEKEKRTLEGDFKLAVEQARECKPPFIELNLSCPNLKKNSDIYDDPDLVGRLCVLASLNNSRIP